MPIYFYKGFDQKTGSNRKGKIEADSERTARQKLKQKEKIIVSDIKEEGKASNGEKRTTLFAPNVTLVELAVMVRQFAVLQNAHVPLDESLKALVAQVENQVLKSTLSQVKDLVSEGKSLADAASQYPNVFNRLFVNMVRAGESSGQLGTVLSRLADFMEYQVQISRQIITAMTYPSIMIVVSSGLVAYLFISVVPKLAQVFENLRVTLPWYTEFLISVSQSIQDFWYVIVFGVVGGYFFLKAWLATESGRKQFDQLILRIPVFGSIMLRIAISRFTKTLATLLSSGVPIIRALDITKNVVTNYVIAEVLEQAKIDVQEGKSLAVCIDRSKAFPGLVTHMIATGEKTGELEQMLLHVSDAYESEIENKISKMVALIEPIMMVFMFSIAGIVIGAMMLPMLNIMSQLR